MHMVTDGLFRRLWYFFRWVFWCFSFLSLPGFSFWSFHFRLCFLRFIFLAWLWSRFGLCFLFAFLLPFSFSFSFHLQVVARFPRLSLLSSQADRANDTLQRAIA